MKKFSPAFNAYFWISVLFLFLISINQKIYNFANSRLPSKNPDHYAQRVVSYHQITGNIKHVVGVTDFPECVRHCGVGLGDYIVLEFKNPLINIKGNDFIVYEVDDSYNKVSPTFLKPNSYEVQASNDLINWILVGYGYGTLAFDLDFAGISSAKYLKLLSSQSRSNSPNSSNRPIIDAVEVLRLTDSD